MSTSTDRATTDERDPLADPAYRAAARRLKAQLRAILDRPDARQPREEDRDDQPAA